MARFTIHPPFTGCRGSIGNVTYSQNRAGVYIRAKTSRGNRATPAQTAVRARMKHAKKRWDALNPVAQQNWITYAAAPNEHFRNALSVRVYLTGFQWYATCLWRHDAVEQAQGAMPPVGQTATSPTRVGFNPMFHATGQCFVTWGLFDFGAFDTVLIQTAMARRPTTKNPETPWRNTYWKFNPAWWQANIYSEVVAQIGLPPLGYLFFVRVLKQTFAGNRSPAITVSRTVT